MREHKSPRCGRRWSPGSSSPDSRGSPGWQSSPLGSTGRTFWQFHVQVVAKKWPRWVATILLGCSCYITILGCHCVRWSYDETEAEEMNHNTNTNRVFFLHLVTLQQRTEPGSSWWRLETNRTSKNWREEEAVKHYNNLRQVIRSTAAVKGGDKKWLAGQK